MKIGLIRRLEDLAGMSAEQQAFIAQAIQHHPFLMTEHYASLIDWNNPEDPLRRIVIPSSDESFTWGENDPSEEQRYTVANGLQHKYPTTALLLVSDQCAGLCRFCFRKRVFQTDNDERLRDLNGALDYIESHKEITNVLLTGGDPLMLSAPYLDRIIGRLRQISHVGAIRIGSKMLASQPHRIIDDSDLLAVLAQHSLLDKRIYLMAHFNHPREISSAALIAVDRLLKSGVIMTNQTPLLRGINDNPDTLIELFRTLAFAGIPPYYIFQCRPTRGNHNFVVPIEEGYQLVDTANGKLSGISKRARFVISHSTGKIEVVGMTEQEIIFRYLRSHEERNRGRVLIFRRNPQALWFDDYKDALNEFSPQDQESYYGPD